MVRVQAGKRSAWENVEHGSSRLGDNPAGATHTACYVQKTFGKQAGTLAAYAS